MSRKRKKKHPSTSAGDPSPVEVKKSKRLWWVLGVIFASGVGLGFGVGRARSPDYTNPGEAQKAIENWTLERAQVHHTRWTQRGSFQQPGIVNLKLASGQVELTCGFLAYPPSSNDTARHTVACPLSHFNTSEEGLEKISDLSSGGLLDMYPRDPSALPELFRHVWYHDDVPREGLDFKESLEIMIGDSVGVSRSVLDARQYWMEHKARGWLAKLRDGAVMVTGAVTGYTLGYYWGYRNDPNCGVPELQPQFKSPRLRERIQARLLSLYQLQFTVDAQHVIQKVDSNMSTEPTLRDVYLPLRAAGLLDCNSGGIRISDALHRELEANSYALFRHAHAPLWIKVSDLLRTMFNSTPVTNDWANDYRYYGFQWWRQLPDHTWEPVDSEVSFVLGT